MTLTKEKKRSSKRSKSTSHNATNYNDEGATQLGHPAKECKQAKSEAGAQSAGY